jgi:hypothetical protein
MKRASQGTSNDAAASHKATNDAAASVLLDTAKRGYAMKQKYKERARARKTQSCAGWTGGAVLLALLCYLILTKRLVVDARLSVVVDASDSAVGMAAHSKADADTRQLRGNRATANATARDAVPSGGAVKHQRLPAPPPNIWTGHLLRRRKRKAILGDLLSSDAYKAVNGVAYGDGSHSRDGSHSGSDDYLNNILINCADERKEFCHLTEQGQEMRACMHGQFEKLGKPCQEALDALTQVPPLLRSFLKKCKRFSTLSQCLTDCTPTIA